MILFTKGSCERNHEFIRCFIPKGVDLGKYTQDDITLMMNHTLRFIPLNGTEQIILSYSDSASKDVVSAATSMAAFLSLGMKNRKIMLNVLMKTHGHRSSLMSQ